MKGDTYALDFGLLIDFQMQVAPSDSRLGLGMATKPAVSLQKYDRLERYEAKLNCSSDAHSLPR